MGYLKSLWLRKYQFLIMSEEGGWTRSYLVKVGYLAVALFLAALLLIGLAGGWVASLTRIADYPRLQAENQRLESYRDKVRHAILNSTQYDLISVDLLRELELSIDLEDEQGRPLSTLDDRRGGFSLTRFTSTFWKISPPSRR